MKKLILLAISIMIFGFIIGTNIKTNSDNTKTKIIVENVNAFAKVAKSCSWSGWFKRGCSASCNDCSYVTCSRKGCFTSIN